MPRSASRARRRAASDGPQEITLHGHRMSYRLSGEGPLVILIHGVAGGSHQWETVMPALEQHYTVLAPDLLGHGESAKPRGDYSLGAYAVSIRDLIVALGYRRGTVVGHSLGGGIAMQFAYEFPVFCERLVVVSSGGLGREVHPLLRAATLPGSELVLPLIASDRIRAAGTAVATALSSVGLRAGPDLAEMARGYGSLADAGARQAFLLTLRAVIDYGGQRVSAADRLYLTEMMPTLVMWGRKDPLIPVEHAELAHERMPGSQLAVFEHAGHFPQLDDPVGFAETLIDFIESTEPTELNFSDADLEEFRDRLLAGA